MQRHFSAPTLRFCDDPMFKRVMQDSTICKGVIERIVGRSIGEITYCNTEQEKQGDITGKTIRLDAYLVEAEGHTYDVEMQIAHNPLLAYRYRGYQSVLDASFLKQGFDYDELRGSYIIFICMKDPFGAGLPVYTIERTCKESSKVTFDCEAHWIALNASAWEALGTNSELGKLLKYVYTNEVSCGDELVETIDARVAYNNKDEEWIMTMIDSVSLAREEARVFGRLEAREEGFKEGMSQGISQARAEGRREYRRYAKLVNKLIDLNRMDDLRRASNNKRVRDKLYREFGL